MGKTFYCGTVHEGMQSNILYNVCNCPQSSILYNVCNCPQVVNQGQSYSFVWQVKSNIAECPPLDLTFSFAYKVKVIGGEVKNAEKKENAEPRKLYYKFHLNHFNVRFEIYMYLKLLYSFDLIIMYYLMKHTKASN